MLAKQFGALIKSRRAESARTQEDLARAAKVSRTVLSRLERGTTLAVQTDVLDRLFAALEVSPRIVDGAGTDGARQRARVEQQKSVEERRRRHYRLAIELAGDEKAAAALIAKARKRVALWRSNRSCSPYYIERWSQLLDLPPRDLAMAMTSLGEWQDALFQNSPWSWAWS